MSAHAPGAAPDMCSCHGHGSTATRARACPSASSGVAVEVPDEGHDRALRSPKPAIRESGDPFRRRRGAQHGCHPRRADLHRVQRREQGRRRRTTPLRPDAPAERADGAPSRGPHTHSRGPASSPRIMGSRPVGPPLVKIVDRLSSPEWRRSRGNAESRPRRARSLVWSPSWPPRLPQALDLVSNSQRDDRRPAVSRDRLHSFSGRCAGTVQEVCGSQCPVAARVAPRLEAADDPRQISLIHRIGSENPLWSAERIQGEFLKLAPTHASRSPRR